MGHLASRARIAGILAISLLMLGAPGASAGTLAIYRPDAEIRLGSGSYVGDDVINATAIGQHSLSNNGVVGQRLTFFIKVTNEALLPDRPDSFKVKRSSGYTNGYRVRYYDASNNDVTGRVNKGTFTTSVLGNGDEYVMRATVKIRPQATLCSFTSRLITVSSVSLPTEKDAVRFTAALAPGCPDLTLSPGNVVATDQYAFNFGPAIGGETQTFTLKNEGTGASDELGFFFGGPSFGIGTDTCGGAILSAGSTCTFEVVTFCSGVNVTEGLGVTGGVPPTIQYLTLFLTALCD